MPAQEEALVGALAPVIRGAIAKATTPLLERIAELESRVASIPSPEKGEPGEDGRDGKDADMSAIERQINERFEDLKKSIPAPEKGKDGRDGVGIVELLQNKQGELIAVMTDGTSKNVGVIQGKDGKDGKPGENANVEAMREIVASMTESKSIDPQIIKSLIPEPVKGERGERGEAGESAYQIAARNGFKGSEREWIESLKGEKGEPGKDGERGEQGERGVDINDIFFNEKNELIIRQSNDIDFNVGDIRGEKGDPGKDGLDGKDAAPVDYDLIEAEVKRLVDEVAKSIPEPKDGKDGKDGKSVERAEVELIVKAAVEALPKPKDGRDGEPGKSMDPETVRAMVSDAVKVAVSGIEQKSIEAQIDPEQLEEIIVRHIGKIETMTPDEIKALVAKEIAGLPKPKDGKDGADADMEAVFAKIEETVKAIPPAKDGRDGKDGKDGRGIDTSFQNEKGELVLKLTDGAEKNVGRIKGAKGEPGKDGAPGANGKDGLGFDDVRLEYDGERSFSFIFERGDDRKKHGPFIVPMLIDRGIFKAGETYQRGDGVTWGGSLWIAAEETSDKPGSDESGWRLAVKKGRDGKDGKPGERGPEGKSGRPGRDLTQINPETGEKW